jgi:RNA polymerase sigma-70 factor (ECF subfamily)
LSLLRALRIDFSDILLACHLSLYRYARSLTREPALAEDLVQEAYRRALASERRPMPLTEDSTRAWLFTIVRNLWHNELRQRNRWAGCAVPVEEADASLESLDVQLTRKLLQSEVRHAIDMLQEAHREVILLRDIEGLSYAEIAQILDCPCGTVMSRLARARESLRAILCAPAPSRREVRR